MRRRKKGRGKARMKEEKGCSQVDTAKSSIERQSKEHSHWGAGMTSHLRFSC